MSESTITVTKSWPSGYLASIQLCGCIISREGKTKRIALERLLRRCSEEADFWRAAKAAVEQEVENAK